MGAHRAPDSSGRWQDPHARQLSSEADLGLEEEARQLLEFLRGAHRCLVLTGAGISTESGIPDFRSPGTGLWERLDPLETLSVEAFWRDPDEFYRVAWRTWLPPLLQAEPNPAHRALASLEGAGLIDTVITQNIDGLHHRAGSRRVYEVHGHVRSGRCVRCRREMVMEAMLPPIRRGEAPRCPCGGVVRPSVVLFGDPMPAGFEAAWALAAQADRMVVIGSNLEVAPANLLPRLAGRLAITNLGPTTMDAAAELVVRRPAGPLWERVARLAGVPVQDRSRDSASLPSRASRLEGGPAADRSPGSITDNDRRATT